MPMRICTALDFDWFHQPRGLRMSLPREPSASSYQSQLSYGFFSSTILFSCGPRISTPTEITFAASPQLCTLFIHKYRRTHPGSKTEQFEACTTIEKQPHQNRVWWKKDKQISEPLNKNPFHARFNGFKNRWYNGKVQGKYRNEIINKLLLEVLPSSKNIWTSSSSVSFLKLVTNESPLVCFSTLFFSSLLSPLNFPK